MPAEWEHHAATWLAWPHNRATWPGHFDKVPTAYARWIGAIVAHEPVHLVASSDQHEAIDTALGQLRNVLRFDIPTNDAWIRDYGPMFVTRGKEIGLIDWQFDSWGGKYPPCDLDNEVPKQIAEQLACRRYANNIVMEGGALDHNGDGVFLVSARSVIRRNARTHSVTELEGVLRSHCGAREIGWIDGELTGDDTDGHIDQLVRFVDAQTIVYAAEPNRHDVNFESLSALKRQLDTVLDRLDTSFRVVSLPMPAPVIVDGARLPASYLNFQFVNGGLIVPQFNQPNDTLVVETLESLLPTRGIIPLPATELVLGLGSFHCLSQQQPATA